MTRGRPEEIEMGAYPDKVFKVHIDSLLPGTGAAFSLPPPENATGNFVKVGKRIPVKIIRDSQPDPASPLRSGLSVVPAVDISQRTGEKPAPG